MISLFVFEVFFNHKVIVIYNNLAKERNIRPYQNQNKIDNI